MTVGGDESRDSSAMAILIGMAVSTGGCHIVAGEYVPRKVLMYCIDTCVDYSNCNPGAFGDLVCFE